MPLTRQCLLWGCGRCTPSLPSVLSPKGHTALLQGPHLRWMPCVLNHGVAGVLRPRTFRGVNKTIWSLYPQGPHPSTERLRVSKKLNLPLVKKH